MRIHHHLILPSSGLRFVLKLGNVYREHDRVHGKLSFSTAQGDDGQTH